MSKKASNPLPKNVCRPKAPPAPPAPPHTTRKQSFFSGFIETKESIRRREDYEMYMRGYAHGLANGRREKK